MIKTVKNMFSRSTRELRSTESDLKKTREWAAKIRDWSDEEIKNRIQEMKDELATLTKDLPEDAFKSIKKVNRREKFPDYETKIQKKLWEFLPEVYAMMNESYRRTLGYEYYDVQLKAGILLAKGQVLVEQYTGEGKTMTFQLPLTLYSLAGRGAHLITVNEYLAKVGGEYAGHIMARLGLSVGIIAPGGTSYKFINDEDIPKYKSEEIVAEREGQDIRIDAMQGRNLIQVNKKEAYNCDITYATNNEMGFDYLRDNMVWDIGKMVQRELYFCIIDEADSILIDEARTPLIISSTPTDADTEKYTKFARAVKSLAEGEEDDFIVDHKSRSASLTQQGIDKVEKFLEVDNIYDDYSSAYHIENALKAKALFIKNDQYIIRNGSVYIVDEFTGRVLEGRRYSEGLHQAIEAKEGVEIQQESKTFATITFQNFFRLYKILCGGSGTVITESEEFYKIYGLDSFEIPTNKPRIRIDNPDRIYKTAEAKFRAIAEEVKEINEIGRPVLIGTASVENSEIVSKLLDEYRIDHEVLNAKYHEEESRIVTQAGKKGSVTVATNMAGRGTDIVVGGGTRGDDAYNEIIELGGLHVIGTERHDSRRIDNQLRGRTGRQGEAGSTRFYVSLEDKIMRVLGGEIIQRLFSVIKVPDDMPIEVGMISRQIETAQKRVEGINFDSRKSIVEYDDVMNQHREIFYARRRNLLQTADQALGRFLQGNKVIDLNLPEFEKDKKNYENRVEENKQKLEVVTENMVESTLDNKIYQILPEKLKEDEFKDYLKKLDNSIPIEIIENTTGKNKNEIKKETLASPEPRQMMVDILFGGFEKKSEEFGDSFYTIVKMVSLESLDKKWVEHLDTMKDVRDSISLQGYAQKNPIVEYKNVAFKVFQKFIQTVNEDIVFKLYRTRKVDPEASGQASRQRVQNLETNDEDISDILTGDREMNLGNDSQNMIDEIDKNRRRTQANLRSNSSAGGRQKVNELKSYGRNDKVTVEYDDGTRKEDVKFKKVQADVEAGSARIV